VSGPLVSFVIGLGAAGGHDQPPGLVDASPQIAGHVEGSIAVDRGAPIVASLSLTMAKGTYDNTQPPPMLVSDPSDRIDFHRIGVGLVVEGRLPLGSSVELALGGGPYVVHSKATASGLLSPFPIEGDYYSAEDNSIGGELRGGIDMRVDPRAVVGLRGGWLWYHADLGAAGGGALGGPWLEVRIAIEWSR